MQDEQLRPVFDSRFHLTAHRACVEVADLSQLSANATRPGWPETLQTMPIALISEHRSGREILNAESVQAELDVRPHASAIFVYEIDRDSLSPIEHRFIVFFYKFIEPILSVYTSKIKNKNNSKQTVSEECSGVIGKLLDDNELREFCLNTILPEHQSVTASFIRKLFNDRLSPSICDKALKKAKNKGIKSAGNNENNNPEPSDCSNQEYEPLVSLDETALAKKNSDQLHEGNTPCSTCHDEHSLAKIDMILNDTKLPKDILMQLETFVDKIYN